jgi:hypothetical protein
LRSADSRAVANGDADRLRIAEGVLRSRFLLTEVIGRESQQAQATLGWMESRKNGYVFLHDFFSANIPDWTKWFADYVTNRPIEHGQMRDGRRSSGL